MAQYLSSSAALEKLCEEEFKKRTERRKSRWFNGYGILHFPNNIIQFVNYFVPYSAKRRYNQGKFTNKPTIADYVFGTKIMPAADIDDCVSRRNYTKLEDYYIFINGVEIKRISASSDICSFMPEYSRSIKAEAGGKQFWAYLKTVDINKINLLSSMAESALYFLGKFDQATGSVNIVDFGRVVPKL